MSTLIERLFYKPLIWDVKNTHCTKQEENALLDIFEKAMQRAALVPASQLRFELTRIVPKQAALHPFVLTMHVDRVCGQMQWRGVFENADNSKTLEVLGALEKE